MGSQVCRAKSRPLRMNKSQLATVWQGKSVKTVRVGEEEFISSAV